MACLSARLCYESRGDASFYVFVASLGILILEARRRHLPEIGVATVLSAIGVWLMLGSGQASSAAQPSDATITVHDRIDPAGVTRHCRATHRLWPYSSLVSLFSWGHER